MTACFICEHSSYLLSLTYISLTAWFVYFQKLKKLNINTVPEKTFTHSQERKRRIRTDNKVHSVAAHPIYGDLSQLTHTHPSNGPFSGTTRVSRYQKGKPIWILLKQETVSSSGISWAICKSAPYSRHITMPAPHHSVFTGRMPFLLPNQQHQSTEGAARPMLDQIKHSWLKSTVSTCNRHLHGNGDNGNTAVTVGNLK